MSAVTPDRPEPQQESEVASSSRWNHSPDVVVSGDLSTRFVLVDLTSPATPPRVLNDSAALVWSEIKDGRTTAAIARGVAAQVDLPVESVHADVESFLLDLHAGGLVDRVPGQGEDRGPA